jgi:hypothetical protein
VSQERFGIALITDSPAGKGMSFLTFRDVAAEYETAMRTFPIR